MILGGIDKVDDRHPLTFEERKNLIKKVYPFGVKFIGLKDLDSWDEWYDSVITELSKIGDVKKQMTLYAHNKPQDNKDFKFKGKYYSNSSYTDIFIVNSIGIKNIDEIKCTEGKVIHASDIRNNEESARNNLDARIYRTLKEKYKWYSEG
jgi:hypothetical protein